MTASKVRVSQDMGAQKPKKTTSRKTNAKKTTSEKVNSRKSTNVKCQRKTSPQEVFSLPPPRAVLPAACWPVVEIAEDFVEVFLDDKYFELDEDFLADLFR